MEDDDIPKIRWINQTRGVKQGSGTSPVFFSLSMTKLLRVTLEKWDGKVLIIAYLDDIVVLSPTLERAEEAFNDVKAALTQAGLELNLSKCELHSSRSQGVPTQEELGLVARLWIQNSPMFLEYLGAIVSSFENNQASSAPIA